MPGGTQTPLASEHQERLVWKVSPLVHLCPFPRTAPGAAEACSAGGVLSVGGGEDPPNK